MIFNLEHSQWCARSIHQLRGFFTPHARVKVANADLARAQPAEAFSNRLHPAASLKRAMTAVLTCVALSVGTGIATAQQTVVFAGWGGSLQKAQREIYFDSFTKETGIRVIDAADMNYAKIKAMVDSGDVQWDVVNALGMWIKPGEKDNLWEPLDYTVIDKAGISDQFAGKYAIGNAQYAACLAYNTKALGKAPAPKTWADFWNVKEFPGRRAFRLYARYLTEAALMADGVPMDKIYPIDVDKAFKSLDKIKSNISVWTRSAEQGVQMLASGEVAFGLATHTRVFDAQKEGLPVAFSWQGGIMTTDNLAVLRGTKNKANAMKLINWMSKAENQARFAEMTAVGPTNENALKLVSDETKEKLPIVHFQKGELLRFDDNWWADNITTMDEKFLVWAHGLGK